MSGGFGTGWGLTPWGGFFLPLTPGPPPPGPPEGFDVFCFFDDPTSMGSILIDPSVDVVAAGGQFSIESGSNDLEVLSGGSFPDSEAVLTVNTVVPSTWTLQVVVAFASLPVDFNSIITSHIYFGGADDAGLAGFAAGLFVSKAGIAYTGAIALNGFGNIDFGGPFQIIPGTAGAIQEGVSYTFRIAVDSVTSTTYIFATETSAVPVVGHRLLAILPAIPTNGLVTDSVTISTRGTAPRLSAALFDQLCLGTGLVIPNLPPRADAGRDQSLRMCTVGMLDGSASFDPEGAPVVYSWRLIDAPTGSTFEFEGSDGFTLPAMVPNGFTDKFYSAELGNESLDDEVLPGDVILVGGLAYSIVTTGVDGNGFFAQITDDLLPDNLTNAFYKLLRQRAITHATAVNPTFFPDVPGIYRFDLVVSDGQLLSEPSVVIVNVLESQVPRGCVPDLGFVWQYLSDFWKLVEDRERIQVFWEGMAQVAAAELMTLWQIDYSKSLRDVQRSFQRRWLHYDLKLAEPVPELSSLRMVYAGVLSQIIVGTIGGLHNNVLEVVSPIHAVQRLVFPLNDPYTPAQVITFLQSRLQLVHPSYKVSLLTLPGGQLLIRINANIPFSIGQGTTVALFNVGDANTFPSGAGGLRLTARTFQVDASLEGLDIREGDLLVIAGEAYQITRVVDEPTDNLRFQRVIVQSDLPLLPVAGLEWSIPGTIRSRFLDFFNGMVTQNDIVVLEVADPQGNLALTKSLALGACATDPGLLAVDIDVVGQAVFAATPSLAKLAYLLRRARLPIGELVMDIPCLQEKIKETDDGAVLRRNVDYFIEEFRGANSLRFVAAGPTDPGDVWEGKPPPERLWAEVTYVDNRPTIEGNFGIPAEFTFDQLAELDTDLDYLSAVRGLWYSYLNGPTMFNLRAGTQILLGLPFAEEAGTIQEIRTDFSPTQGRILVADAANAAVVRSYSFPSSLALETNPATGVPYKEGDAVTQFAPLVQGAEALDYVKDPRWFEGILNQGVFFEVEKFHKFLVRVDSAAFSLSSLLFVRSFILRVKPTYTFPLFVVREKVGDTEVSVSDEVVMSGRLILNAGACFPNFGAATMFDQYRPAGGGVRNQFDSDPNPNNPPPTFPTPDSTITWGYDKLYLCPEDEIVISWCVAHAGGVVQFDEGFSFDAANSSSHHFSDTGITTIPAGPAGFTLPGTSPVTLTGSLETLTLVVSGTLGADPGNYEIVVEVNGADIDVIPVTITPSGLIANFTLSTAVTSGGTVNVRIRPATGGARHPVWSYLAITINQNEIAFAYDTGLPAGSYCFSKVA